MEKLLTESFGNRPAGDEMLKAHEIHDVYTGFSFAHLPVQSF
jgi:hypothetical protein